MTSTLADRSPHNVLRVAKEVLHDVLVGVVLWQRLSCTTSAQDEAAVRSKHVVVLYSYKTLMPVNVAWDRGIRRALAEELGQGVELNIEYLDPPRYGDAECVRN